MNGPHLHLLTNHLPVMGSLFALVVVGLALLRSGNTLRRVSLLLLVIVGLLGLPAYFSGEPAEDGIEHRAGVEKARIEEHEEAAKWAMVMVEVAALVGLVGLVLFRSRPVPRGYMALALVIGLVSAAAFARTANLGGEISHPEIRAGAAVAPGGEGAAGGGAGEAGEAGESGEHAESNRGGG